MEKEEREAQSAKLQELIRRGTPEDLQEANRLMKIMTGYDTRSKTDYRAKAAEEMETDRRRKLKQGGLLRKPLKRLPEFSMTRFGDDEEDDLLPSLKPKKSGADRSGATEAVETVDVAE